MENIKYMVRVSCMTYNQASYIEDAMNGFCMQETHFPFVCTIVDDCSTDGEQKVIKNYLQEHFDLEDASVVRNEETDDYCLTFAQHKTNKNCYFAILFLKYNHYSIKKPKMPYLREWCDTKYMAICEGDDYWIDPLKLKKQVDYMAVHSKCSLCYTSAKVFDQELNAFLSSTLGEPCDSFETLLKKNVIPTLTVLYKSEMQKGYNEEINPLKYKWSLGDYPLWLWMAAHGEIHYISDKTGVYRKMVGSASHPTSADKFKKLINDANDIAVLFDQKFNNGNLTKYREHLRYRGLMTIEANYNHSLSGVVSCFRKMPAKTMNDLAGLLKSVFQICCFTIFKH